MLFQDIVASIWPLPAASFVKLEGIAEEMTVKKHAILLKANRVEPVLYFIKTGIVRAYTHREANDITFWFGTEGQVVLSMKSYVANQPAYESIELLEDCELYRLTTHSLQALFATDIHIANWGRKLAETELMKVEERLISAQFKTATERYADLLHHHPGLLQRVALGHIASYLGITQASLSRIRADVK